MDDVHEIDTFLSIRPEYTREHVAAIAEAMRKGGIPFCHTCADWHHPNEEHSEG